MLSYFLDIRKIKNSTVSDWEDINNSTNNRDNLEIYKKINKKNHIYNVPINIVSNVRTEDYFISLKESILPELHSVNLVNDDYLLGYYFINYFQINYFQINHFQINNSLDTYHLGLSSDSILKGIYSSVIKKINPKQWHFSGTDKKIIPKYNKLNKYINGNTNGNMNGNIFNIQVLQSVKNHMIEQNLKYDIMFLDINYNTYIEFLHLFILAHNQIKLNGYIILRLPRELSDVWISAITYINSIYSNVFIFKTPWGILPKYYLVISDIKNKVSILSLYNYLEECRTTSNLHIIDDSQIKNQINIAKYISELYNADPEINENDAINMFLD